jgi:hypothetical protein
MAAVIDGSCLTCNNSEVVSMLARVSALALALVLTNVPGALAAQPTLGPIPSMYCGDWWHHGSNLTITCASPDAADVLTKQAQMLAQWRVYQWCKDPVSGRNNPPPCDSTIGNGIYDGGIASLVITHVDGSDDRSVTATVVATNVPAAFGQVGSPVAINMLPGNMLQIAGDFYCGANTDTSQYPQYPCGA